MLFEDYKKDPILKIKNKKLNNADHTQNHTTHAKKWKNKK